MRVFNTCTNLVRTLPTLPISKTNSEDVDTKTEDHAYDALRYMVMSRQTSANLYNIQMKQQQQTQHVDDAVFGY